MLSKFSLMSSTRELRWISALLIIYSLDDITQQMLYIITYVLNINARPRPPAEYTPCSDKFKETHDMTQDIYTRLRTNGEKYVRETGVFSLFP